MTAPKSSNLLHVSGIVRDGVRLWAILRAFEESGAADVEVRSVVMPDAKPAALPLQARAPSKSRAPNITLVLDAMVGGKVTSIIAIANRTGLSRKQTGMALYNLAKAGKVQRVKASEYMKVAS